MKRAIAIIALLMVLLACMAFADVPQLLSYQGVITNPEGSAIEDNIHAVKFKIYADSISEIAFWESNGFVSVQTTDGKFNHILGSTNLLPDTLSNLSDLWLGISVGLADEIEPRAHLLKVQMLKESTPIKPKVNNSDTFRKNQYSPSVGVIFKAGIDIMGKHKVSGLSLSGSEDVTNGFSFGFLLYFMNGYGTLRAGIGGELQISREQKDFNGDFNFKSLFFTLMAHPSIYKGNMQPFFVGKLGYNYFGGDSDYKGTGFAEADLSGGVLYGFGLGLISERVFQVEVMYTKNNGNAQILGRDFDVSYSKVSITIAVIIDSKDY